MSFVSLGLHADILRGIEVLGFKEPTSIQKDAIPPALQGRDVLACSMTGSGKTAAFGLPILHRLMTGPRHVSRALILTPTRELAAQIEEHLKELAQFTKLRATAVYGGVGMFPQQQALKRGLEIVVATPGRLLDHMRMPYAKLDKIEVLVLDEADRMLDMGFLPDIRRIMERLPKQRQTLLFSATLPGPIKALAKELLREPVNVNIERKAMPATGLTQAVYPVPHHLKASLLTELVRTGKARSVLAFTRTKHRADRLAQFLERQGIASARIHGDRTQAQRTQALEGFKRGRYRVLVATDVAARGIDVDELGLVVNVDMPREPEDYIHRVGRTARAQAKGDALTFVSPDEEQGLRAIERAIGTKLERRTLEGFDYRQASPERRDHHRAPHGHRGHGQAAHHAPRRDDHHREQRQDRHPSHAHAARPRHANDERAHHGHEERPRRAHDERARHGNEERPRYAHGDRPRQGHQERPRRVEWPAQPGSEVQARRRFERADRTERSEPGIRNEHVELHERHRRSESAAGETRPWARPEGERKQTPAQGRPGHVPFWKNRKNKPQRRAHAPHAVNG